MGVDFGKTLSYSKPGGKIGILYGCRFDEDSDPEYHMFVGKDQDWVVIRQTESTQKIEYAAGRGGIQSNWDDRASLTYYDYWEIA